MAWQVFKGKRNNTRLSEVKRMFKLLEENPGLAASIDMKRQNITAYAKKLGYKISTAEIDKSHIEVRLK
jgi:hypothetical protein